MGAIDVMCKLLHFVSSFLVLHQGMAKDWPGFWRGSRPAYPRVAIPEPVLDKRRLMVCIIFFHVANQ